MAVILVGLLCVMSALWSCQAELIPSSVGDAPNQGNGIWMYTRSKTYKPGTETITLQIFNSTGGDIAYGLEWQMEINRNGEWFVLPLKETATIQDIAMMVADGETGKLTLDLSMLDYKLSEGGYRVVKNINGSTYAAEFAIEKDAPDEAALTLD